MSTRVRHRTAPMPLGCRWCGWEQREHCRLYVNGHGWHSWVEPTREQVRARLRELIRRRSPHLVEVAW